jgi:hypothetical protein
VNEQRRVEPFPPSAAGVAGLGDASDPATVREVFRAKHRLGVSVMERAHQYRVAYSLAEIHRLTFLSHEERAAVETEWGAWHRKYKRLGTGATALWLTGAVVAWGLWFRAESVAAMVASLGLSISGVWFTIAAVITGLALVVSLPAFLATLFTSAIRDSYVRGYSDGLTRGVNRALRITPEIEAEMWEELRQAERVDAALSGSRGSAGSVGSEGPVQGSMGSVHGS